MEIRPRSRIGAGLCLILLVGFLLFYQLFPSWREWLPAETGWPLIVVGIGAALLVLGLFTGQPGLAVPACIVGGIGGLLWWQNSTGNWGSWAYAWTLIPGFVGVGTILAGLLGEGKLRDALEGGAWLVFISLTMFAIFGSFLGGLDILGNYWPVLLIAAGVVLLIRALFRRS